MGFKWTTLGKFIKVQGGYAYRSKDFISSGNNRVLKIKNIRFGSVDYDDTVFIRDELASATCQYKTKPKDVLISMTGSGPNAPNSLVGRVARIWEDEPEAWINQRVGRLELIEEKSISLDFVYYLLTEKKAQDFLVSNSSGSANQANISGKTIESLPCPNVSFSESKNISQILLSFDNKIQLNNQINQTLEAMAQAIFKSWFVDFDPVRAKHKVFDRGGSFEDGERAAMRVISSKTDEQLDEMVKSEFAELQQTANLFPSKLVDSELGEIPEGWEVSVLSEMINITGGGTPKRSEEGYWGGDIPWFSIKDIPKESDIFVTNTEECITELGLKKSSTKLLEKGTTIITARGTVGKLALTSRKICINQSCYGITGKEVGKFYNYYNLKLATDTLKKNVHGAVFDTITTKTFDSYKTVNPDKDISSKFEIQVEPLMQKIESNLIKNQTLAELRDTLLPKLLLGELDVSEFLEENE